MAGSRGTHDDSDGAGWPDKNMPAPSPRKQKDFGPSSKRGSHSLDDSDNTLQRPRELRPGIDAGGDEAFNAQKGEIEFGKAEPRRSHS